MPSAKGSKTSQVQHPPSNRAFALRMMNSSMNTEGRTSPLDKALKPFRDFKKYNRSKKQKDKGSQSPTASSHSDQDTRDEETPDTSFEFGNERHRHDMPWSSQSKKQPYQENRNGRSGEFNHGKSAHSVTYADNRFNDRLHGGHRGMADIAEEEELYYYGQGERHVGYKEQMDYERYADFVNGNRLAANNMHNLHMKAKNGVSSVPLEATTTDQMQIADDHAYFVAPNGEMVRLRKKKTDERIEGNGENAANTLRTEKFGKRLSMLCHMLAEKYPEDFHILELLVELQVSNEKREEEMNKSVSLLKKKVQSMEERLALLEQQSVSGFHQMLIPLAAAAEAFSTGMKHSLSSYEQCSNSRNQTDDKVDIVCKEQSEAENNTTVRSSFCGEEEINDKKSLEEIESDENTSLTSLSQSNTNTTENTVIEGNSSVMMNENVSPPETKVVEAMIVDLDKSDEYAIVASGLKEDQGSSRISHTVEGKTAESDAITNDESEEAHKEESRVKGNVLPTSTDNNSENTVEGNDEPKEECKKNVTKKIGSNESLISASETSV